MTEASARDTSWYREPLLHFLLIGAGLFALYHFVRGDGELAPKEIVVSEARIEALAESFARTWMRPPTARELSGLVDDFVKEEIFYREAVGMGLDRDDTVIRRRLRQKLEFISDDFASAIEPTDEQLQVYLDEHPEKFVNPAQITFQQIFMSTERRGESASKDAEKLLTELRAGRGPADPVEVGDPSLLPPGLEAASLREIARTFGEDFAAQLDELPVGQWMGPVQSGFGLHLVKVSAREASSIPTLNDVRPSVVREWQAEQQQELGDAFYDQLRQRYEVNIEGELGEQLKQAREAWSKEEGKP